MLFDFGSWFLVDYSAGHPRVSLFFSDTFNKKGR